MFKKITSHEELLTRLLLGMLGAIALQNLAMRCFDLLDLLDRCWTVSLAVLAAYLYWAIRQWRNADHEARDVLLSAWNWSWPWIMTGGKIAQILLYPPSMADSLSYRLPRLFLVLQNNNSINHFITPDYRMQSMPWGWELLALPFASLNWLGAARLINLVAWICIYQLIHAWSWNSNPDRKRARWIALTLSTAPVLLMQSASTSPDIYSAALLLTGAWMMHRFSKTPNGILVMASLLAIILAANVKPQFLTLGLPWLAWWAFTPGLPRKRVAWWLLLAAAPLYVMLSPLPQLLTNFQQSGNLIGAPDLDMISVGHASKWKMMLAGTIQFGLAQLQTPVFPMGERFSTYLSSIPFMESLHAAVPKFGPHVPTIPTIDNASFGLFHFVLICTGVILALRIKNRRDILWMIGVGFCFFISASQVVPSTIGRSFMGFVALLLPMAAAGLSSLRSSRALACACTTSCFLGMTMIVINPSAPLWPAASVQEIAGKNGFHDLENQISKYRSYQSRAYTGVGILDPVPAGDPVAILIRQVTPVVNLWRPDWKAHQIEYVHTVDPAEFQKTAFDWLVVSENSKEMFPEAYKSYTNLPGWEQVKQMTYLSTIREGPENWTLYHRTGGSHAGSGVTHEQGR